MSVITLDGLTKKQKALAQILWSLASQNELDVFLANLSLQDKRDAELVLEMMVISGQDEVTDVELASNILDKIRSN